MLKKFLDRAAERDRCSAEGRGSHFLSSVGKVRRCACGVTPVGPYFPFGIAFVLFSGLRHLYQEIETLTASSTTTLAADIAFKLHDTYGFPLDLTQLVAAEAGLRVDMVGAEELLERQRDSGRLSWKGSNEAAGVPEGVK